MPVLPRRERPSCGGTRRAAKRGTLGPGRLGWRASYVVGVLFCTLGCQSKMFHVERVPIDPTVRELQLSAVHGYGTPSARCATGIQFTLQGSMRGRAIRRIYGGSNDGPFTITDLDAGTYEVWAAGSTCGSYRTDVLVADGERAVTVFDVSAGYREAESAPIDEISCKDAAMATAVISGTVGLTLLLERDCRSRRRSHSAQRISRACR